MFIHLCLWFESLRKVHLLEYLLSSACVFGCCHTVWPTRKVSRYERGLVVKGGCRCDLRAVRCEVNWLVDQVFDWLSNQVAAAFGYLSDACSSQATQVPGCISTHTCKWGGGPGGVSGVGRGSSSWRHPVNDSVS
jgi:hypothetical protein